MKKNNRFQIKITNMDAEIAFMGFGSKEEFDAFYPEMEGSNILWVDKFVPITTGLNPKNFLVQKLTDTIACMYHHKREDLSKLFEITEGEAAQEWDFMYGSEPEVPIGMSFKK